MTTLFIHKESVTEIIIISQSYPTYALQLTGTSTVRKLDQTLCWWSGPQPWEGRAPLTTASVVASAVMALVGMNKVKKQSLSHVNRSQHRAGDGEFMPVVSELLCRCTRTRVQRRAWKCSPLRFVRQLQRVPTGRVDRLDSQSAVMSSCAWSGPPSTDIFMAT